MSVLCDGHVQVIRSTGPFYGIDTSTGEPIPAEPVKLPFDAISVDLAEYSLVYVARQRPLSLTLILARRSRLPEARLPGARLGVAPDKRGL